MIGVLRSRESRSHSGSMISSPCVLQAGALSQALRRLEDGEPCISQGAGMSPARRQDTCAWRGRAVGLVSVGAIIQAAHCNAEVGR